MLLIILALGLSQQREVIPESHKGSALYRECQAAVTAQDHSSKIPISENDIRAALECAAYIDGFTDGVAALDRGTVCIEEDVPMGTLIRVYLAYMVRNPKMMDDYKAIGVYGAYKETYPCKK